MLPIPQDSTRPDMPLGLCWINWQLYSKFFRLEGLALIQMHTSLLMKWRYQQWQCQSWGRCQDRIASLEENDDFALVPLLVHLVLLVRHQLQGCLILVQL